MGRIEGASLALLFGAMAVRMSTGFSLDGHSGHLGWAHGALTLLYLQVILTTARALRWRPQQLVAALVSTLIPFGPWLLERRMQVES